MESIKRFKLEEKIYLYL